LKGILSRRRTLLWAWLPLALLAGALSAASASAEVTPFEVSEYRKDFAMPVQQAEETLETQATGAEGDIAGRLQEGLGSRYAGIWFDNQAGEFVVPVLGGAARAEARNELMAAELQGEYRTVSAQSSWAELEAAQEPLNQALFGLMSDGMIQTAIDPRTNAVVIYEAEGVEGPERAAVQRLASQAGVEVEVRERGVEQLNTVPAACSTIGFASCDSPMRGAVAIGKDGTVAGDCSSGFKAMGVGTGNRYMLTAGHCVLGGGGNTQYWMAEDSKAGDHYLGYAEQAAWGNGFDIAKINANGTYWDVSPWPNWIVEWGKGGNEFGYPVDGAHPITSEALSYVGEWVCHSGISTGSTCGYVKAMGITVSGVFGGQAITVNNLSEVAPVCSELGDSGGPVYAGNTALGLTSFVDSVLPQCNNYVLYTNITEDTQRLGVSVAPRLPPKHFPDELGFVAFKTAPKNTHIDTYATGPTYQTLLGNSDTGYPAVSEPQKMQALAIDTDGDGIDELGFAALSNPGNVHLDTYKGAPAYQALASNCNTAYPSIADPSKVQALALDVNGDGVDELGFAALSNPGNVHLDVYAGPPCYQTLISNANTGYPSIADPSKVQALAIDTDGDGIDELGFAALSNPGNVHLDTYKGAPAYQALASNCNTAYPSIAESSLKNIQALAMDWNGDGLDELGFLALKGLFGNAHLDGYVNPPCYNVLASNYDTAYPSISTPENIQALALNLNTTAYAPPPLPPAVQTTAATGVQSEKATLNGTVNPNGTETSYRFEYGKSTAYGKSIPVPNAGAGAGSKAVAVFLSPTLQPRTRYHYRLVATNAGGSTYGADQAFTTGLRWYLRNSNTTGSADGSLWFGTPGEKKVSGDWDGNGTTTVGTYDPATGTWKLRNSNTTGGTDVEFQYGGSQYTPITGDWDGNGTTTIGLFEPTAGKWLLRNANSGGGADVEFQYGGSQYTPITGDWDGNKTTTIGLFEPATGKWLLRNANSGGGANVEFQYGGSQYTPITGDWDGNKTTTIGLFEPTAGKWLLRNANSGGGANVEFQYGGSQFAPLTGDWDGNGTDTAILADPNSETVDEWRLRNTNSTGNADVSFEFSPYGPKEVSGDWDGNGTTTTGTYDPATGTWRLRNSNTTGGADVEFQYGGSQYTPITGDWDGNGTTTIGLFEPTAGKWLLRNANSGGGADVEFQYGGSQYTPITGDWDGNKTTTIGLFEPATGKWLLRNANSGGGADVEFQYGGSQFTPVTGDWDGNKTTTIGLYEPTVGNWLLRNANSGGGANVEFQYGGGSAWGPISGDWDGNGTDTVGLGTR
jgi:hypothetical protein